MSLSDRASFFPTRTSLVGVFSGQFTLGVLAAKALVFSTVSLLADQGGSHVGPAAPLGVSLPGSLLSQLVGMRRTRQRCPHLVGISGAAAGMSGMRHLRKLIAEPGLRIVPLGGGDYTDVR
jgi:hypothetical protein